MDEERTLSDIARSVLVSGSETDPRSLREKAGLLALLDLLGIVESFYGDSQSARTPASLLRSIAGISESAAEQPQAKEPDLASSIMSLAAKFLGSGQGQGGFDPALISTLLGAVSAMSKARALSPRPGARAAEDEVSPDDIEEGEESQSAKGAGESDGDREDAGEGTEGKSEPAKPPQSPLQQILGIDPRIITLALNVLADLMKARNAQPDKQTASPPRGEATEVTLTPDGKTVVIPTTKRQPRERLYHKPGLGIYRHKPEVAPE